MLLILTRDLDEDESAPYRLFSAKDALDVYLDNFDSYICKRSPGSGAGETAQCCTEQFEEITNISLKPGEKVIVESVVMNIHSVEDEEEKEQGKNDNG